MKKAGVRDLRQQASALLRRVQQGETIEITDRGQPVALLSPLPAGGPLERLRAEGEVEPATFPFGELPPPRKRRKGEPVLSGSLARLREDER